LILVSWTSAGAKDIIIHRSRQKLAAARYREANTNFLPDSACMPALTRADVHETKIELNGRNPPPARRVYIVDRQLRGGRKQSVVIAGQTFGPFENFKAGAGLSAPLAGQKLRRKVEVSAINANPNAKCSPLPHRMGRSERDQTSTNHFRSSHTARTSEVAPVQKFPAAAELAFFQILPASLRLMAKTAGRWDPVTASCILCSRRG